MNNVLNEELIKEQIDTAEGKDKTAASLARFNLALAFGVDDYQITQVISDVAKERFATIVAKGTTVRDGQLELSWKHIANAIAEDILPTYAQTSIFWIA